MVKSISSETEKHSAEEQPMEINPLDTGLQKTKSPLVESTARVDLFANISQNNLNEAERKSELGIPKGTVERIIDVVNAFNAKSVGNGLSNSMYVSAEGFAAEAFGTCSLGEKLRGTELSRAVVYNNKLRGCTGNPVFFTADFRFAIKIIKKGEFEFLKKNFFKFVEYYEENPNTLLSRYLGAYEYTIRNDPPVYFVVMENAFDGLYEEIYDLKGRDVQRANNSGILLEHNWLGQKLQADNIEEMACQLERDTAFLASLSLMDYSLVIGVGPVESHSDFKIASNGVDKEFTLPRNTRAFSIGIVDMLTVFNATKAAESCFNFFTCRKNMSSVNPRRYRRRFMSLIKNECFSKAEND